MSVISQLNRESEKRHKYAQDILKDISNLIETKSSDYGKNIRQTIDLVGATTGFSKASHIPEAERHIATRLEAKILRYMNLRSSKDAPNHESLLETVQDIIGEAAGLFGEVRANLEHEERVNG